MPVKCQVCKAEIADGEITYQHFVNSRIVVNCESCEPPEQVVGLKDDTVPEVEESACAWRELVGID